MLQVASSTLVCKIWAFSVDLTLLWNINKELPKSTRHLSHETAARVTHAAAEKLRH